MDELENKNFEEEFFNVLGEQDSTLILGAADTGTCPTYSSGCTAYCQTFNADCPKDRTCRTNACECYGECFSFVCNCDTGFVCDCDGGPCFNDCSAVYCQKDTCKDACSCDSDIPTTTYYWWAGGEIVKRGYYLDSEDESYLMPSARTKFTSTISASSSTYAAICNTLTGITDNVNRIKQYGATKFYMSGTGTTIIGATGSVAQLIGYINCIASATTHMHNNGYIRVYALSTTSQTQFNNLWSLVTGTSTAYPNSTIIKIPEKTFTIDVYSGTSLIQGANISINSAEAIFPQLGNSQTRLQLRTGTGGRICLCTSSTTSNTITGTINRKGLYGGNAKAFTATAGTILTVQLTGNTATTDAETVVVLNAKSINPEGVNVVFTQSQSGLNLTKQILLNHNFSSTTLNGQDSTAYNNVVLRFNNTKKIEPGLAYYLNDPFFGKVSNSSYLATGLTLSTSLQSFATISWDISSSLRVVLPQIQNTNGSSTATVLFWCTLNSTNYYLDSLNVSPGATGSTFVSISYEHLTGVMPVGSSIVTLTLKANLATSVSGVKLIAGSYSYAQTGGGNHPVS
jgi:hypothetical protein